MLHRYRDASRVFLGGAATNAQVLLRLAQRLSGSRASRDGSSGASLARAETKAREQGWCFVEVLRRRPGFETACVIATGPQVGIRETRRPQSRRDVAREDAIHGGRHGAGSAIAYALCEMGIASLCIVDLDVERVTRLWDTLASTFPHVVIQRECSDLSGLDLVANATPVGTNQTDPLPLP